MWSLVSHQLENARKLARLDGDPPRQASLRRAVSTAYYALFQALCETCAATLVGWDKPWDVFTPIFRALEHGRAKQVLIQYSSAAETPPDLQLLANAFISLQAAREWADYSPEPRPDFASTSTIGPFTRDETEGLIEEAEKALACLDRLDAATRLKLATRLITKTRK